jgi:hypothetical protein
MATLKEMLDQRIPRVRQPRWSDVTYIRLPLLPAGKVGLWAELYDEPGQVACEVEVGSQKFCVVLPGVANSDGYEPYTGEPHPAEAKNFARAYSEV